MHNGDISDAAQSTWTHVGLELLPVGREPKNLLSHFDLLRQPEETPGYLASCSALKAAPGIGSLAAVRKTAPCASMRDAYGQGFSMNDAHLVRPVPATRPCLELHRNRFDFAVLLQSVFAQLAPNP